MRREEERTEGGYSVRSRLMRTLAPQLIDRERKLGSTRPKQKHGGGG